MSSKYLILTVGTGTPGRDSSLVEGLRTTIKLIKPLKFWLIPSLSEDSIATADLVREGLDTFMPWSEDSNYLHIAHADSLSDCRQTVRLAIREAQSQLNKGDRLIVNPTSGTKQMSAGATIAALDENLGEIVFTIGERSEGIVKTGTEKIETFEAKDYFAERDFLTASKLYAAGSHQAAAEILRLYPKRFAAEEALCRCVHQWEALNYKEALMIAETKVHPDFSNFLHHLRPLSAEIKSASYSLRIASDLHKSASRLYSRKDYAGALFRSCKAYEIMARLDFQSHTGLAEPIDRLRLLSSVKLPNDLHSKYSASKGNKAHMGLQEITRVLSQYPSIIGDHYKDRPIVNAISIRNALAHDVRAVTRQEALSAMNAMAELLKSFTPPAPVNLPASLHLTSH